TLEQVAAAPLDPVVRQRARHVVTEIARTSAAVSAIAAHDIEALGSIFAQSHASMRDDFAITVPDIDRLVALLHDAIGPFGGARMTGGGFGGAVVAVLETDAVPYVTAAITRSYRTPAGVPPSIMFERCAGCHGVLRKGATGKNLEPHWEKTEGGQKTEGGTLKLGTTRLENIIAYGTEGGMVNYDDILTKEEINMMARYLQHEPPVPPEFSLQDMKDSWNLIVPLEERVTKQMNKVNLNNVFAVTLRDAGKLALIDGDTHKIWKILESGYAVHISRMSASGRYVYTTGRDGLTTIIDLWPEEPMTVATVRFGSDMRSVDVSKYKGYEDKYLIGGTYWPPQYGIVDGLT
ncbi:MAG: hypothetical protein B7Z23_13520, partial [Pseudomonadales bacterium 32-61-5]